MEQKFIERLTDEQVLNFLYKHVGRRILVSLERNENYIYARAILDYLNYGEYGFSVALYDYDVDGYHLKSEWLKYMYGIFGEEYKQAYLSRCVRVFE